ncbi:hypothetical protein ACYSNM_03530 [Myroides sp. LJL116]
MAKQLKVIQCPQCGSVKKQLVKEDHYLCDHCNAEYYIDNDDVNINVKHHYQDQSAQGSTNNAPKRKTVFIIIAAIALLLIVTPLIITTVFIDKSRSSYIYDTKGDSRERNYRERIEDYLVYTSKENQNPIVILRTKRTFSGEDQQESMDFMRFYDPIKGQVLNEVSLKGVDSDNYLEVRRFSNGVLYISFENTGVVYRVDEYNNTLEDITETMFGNKPEFSSGIATLNFVIEVEGDGFIIMTNNGKEYYYYPLADKLYSSFKELRTDTYDTGVLLADATETPHYVFSQKSTKYPQEKIQLIKYWYTNNVGYPTRLPYSNNVKWDEIPIFPDISENYSGRLKMEKKLFNHSRIRKFVDLTPERLYFDAKIVYQDSNSLYITALPNANPKSARFVQKIDTNTGEVVWTFTPSESIYSYGDFYGYDGGLVFKIFNYGSPRFIKIITIDLEGNVINEFDADGDNFLNDI